MNILISILLLSLALSGCGGGGDSGNDASSTSAQGRFTLDTQEAYISGEIGGNSASSVYIMASVSNRVTPVYIMVDVSNASTFIESAEVVTYGENSGTLVINPISEQDLGVGTYTGTAKVSVCDDKTCNTHLAGSPKTIEIIYVITQSQTTIDDDNDGVMNAYDEFPNNSTESLDTDEDGVGNNADLDDDNDGVPDDIDQLPLDSRIAFTKTTLNFNLSGKNTLYINSQAIECNDGCSYDWVYGEIIYDELSDDYFQKTFTGNSLAFSFAEQPTTTFGDYGDNPYCNYQYEGQCTLNFSCRYENDKESCTGLNTEFVSEIDFNINFIENPHIIVQGQSMAGSFISQSTTLQCSENCDQKLYINDEATTSLMAIPEAGYTFDGWQGACSGIDTCELPFVDKKVYLVQAFFSLSSASNPMCPDDNQVVAGEGIDTLSDLNDIGRVEFICGSIAFIAGKNTSKIYKRNIATQNTLATYDITLPVVDMVLDQKNNLLYATHWTVNQASNIMTRIDLTTGAVLSIPLPSNVVTAVELTPNGDLFVDSSGISIYDSKTTVPKVQYNNFNVSGIQYLTDTEQLVSQSYVYDYNRTALSLTLSEELSLIPDILTRCSPFFVSPDGQHSFNSCSQYDDSTGEYTIKDYPLFSPDHLENAVSGQWILDDRLEAADFSKSSQFVLLAEDDEAKIFSTSTYTEVDRLTYANCTSNKVIQVGISKDNQLFWVLKECSVDGGNQIEWRAYTVE